MANGKKKNAKNLILLCLLLICMVSIYVFLTKPKKSEETPEEQDSVSLTDWKNEEVNGIQYVGEMGSISLAKDGETWKLTEEKDFPLNQTYAAGMANTMANVKTTRTIAENCENPEEYGLSEKTQNVLQITVNAAEKDSAILLVGNEVPDNGGYYAMLKGKNTVYTVDNSIFSSFQYTRNQLMELENYPEIGADAITGLSVTNKNGSDFSFTYEEKNIANPWKIEKVYKEAVDADSSKVSDFLQKYSGVSYLEGVEYKGNHDAKYGLKEPAAAVEIDYYETAAAEDTKEADKELKKIPRKALLLIGHQDERSNYYVKLEGSSQIHTMSSDTIESMLEVKPFDLVDTSVMLYDITSLASLEVGYNGISVVFTGKHETKKGEYDTEETTHTYYFNGKETDTDQFKNLYGKLTSLSVQKERTKEKKEVQPMLTLKLKLQESDDVIETAFYQYDENYVSVEMKGQELFLTDARQIDDFIKAMEEYQS